MKSFKLLKVVLVALIFSVALSGTAFAGRQDFLLINETGRDIINLYITPSDTFYWDDDILGVDILANGDSEYIYFSRRETDRYWDMMATFSDGYELVWEDIDLFRVSIITLRFDGLAFQD